MWSIFSTPYPTTTVVGRLIHISGLSYLPRGCVSRHKKKRADDKTLRAQSWLCASRPSEGDLTLYNVLLILQCCVVVSLRSRSTKRFFRASRFITCGARWFSFILSRGLSPSLQRASHGLPCVAYDRISYIDSQSYNPNATACNPITLSLTQLLTEKMGIVAGVYAEAVCTWHSRQPYDVLCL